MDHIILLTIGLQTEQMPAYTPVTKATANHVCDSCTEQVEDTYTSSVVEKPRRWDYSGDTCLTCSANGSLVNNASFGQ